MSCLPDTIEMGDGDEFVEKYIEKLSKSSLEKSRPLWDIHLLNVKTSDGAESVAIFRIHHSLGDGTSLMSLLLACTRQAAKPNELPTIPALAAGMSAKLMVEVTSEVSSLTVALAAAARQTGGKVVCIIPESKVNESKQVIEDSGLEDRVKFETRNPVEV